ncbi:hypothetical protein QQ045_015031 [Rhodiola kirilowii]
MGSSFISNNLLFVLFIVAIILSSGWNAVINGQEDTYIHEVKLRTFSGKCRRDNCEFICINEGYLGGRCKRIGRLKVKKRCFCKVSEGTAPPPPAIAIMDK